MKIKKILISTVAASGIGLASLGAGAGIASAAPAPTQSHSHVTQAAPQQRPSVAPAAVRRPDTKPFNFRGQRVTPQFSNAHHGWGFWFFGFWVPLAF